MAKKNVTQGKAGKKEKVMAIYDGVMKCDSAIPECEINLLADIVRDNDRMGIPWRMTAVLAGKRGEFFRDVAENEETAKTLAATIDPLRDFAKMLRKVAKLADCVSPRVTIVVAPIEPRNPGAAKKE